MGNTATARRNSVLTKQESSSSDGNHGRITSGSRQNTITVTEEEPPQPVSAASSEATASTPPPSSDPPPQPLTAAQKQILQETWRVLEDDIAKVGVITFISLFETHPDVQDAFMPFSGIELEDLKHSKQLRAHALRVMAFVQKAVARLDEPEKLDSLLRELGKKHFTYGAKHKYIDLIGPQFIQAIRPSLEQQWTAETAAAWTALFAHMGAIMKAEMVGAEEEANRAKAAQ
ncbi:cytoglobin-2 [Nilaparvata lugens]|uniref:cytoglobin-2 n=1 Tax=Nilaparvata lugens TaxID=108931 RepID=UPI00193D7CF7|nr:cytoglobin-2 [Nilaparvata lugens]